MTKAVTTAKQAFINGRIFTADQSAPWAEACLVEDGRFVKVGSTEEIRSASDVNTSVIDLRGRMAMPGIHDAHIHLFKSALKRLAHFKLPDEDQTEENIVLTIQNFCQCCRNDRFKLGNWKVGGDVKPKFFAEGLDRDYLDKAFPDDPVYIFDYTQHHALVNSKALRLAGIDANTPDPRCGKIIRRPGTNEPTGELVERATWPARLAIPNHTPEDCREIIEWSLELTSSFGITSVQEASASKIQLDAMKAIDESVGLPMRVAAHLVWKDSGPGMAPADELDRLIEERSRYQTAHIDPNFIKVWLDGAPLPPHPTHSAIDPATNTVDYTWITLDHDEMLEGFLGFDKAGLGIKVHCAGDGAARVALDIFEEVRRINGPDGPAHEIAHAAFIHPDDMTRLKPSNIIAEMSPALWHRKEPEFKILDEGFKFATVLDMGVSMTIGSDWIITPDPNPFPPLQGMLERGSESVGLERALRCITIDGVTAVGKQHIAGTIAVGKSADLIVLDRNLFEVDTSEIGDTQVLMTIFEGRTVFERPEVSV